MLRVCTLSIEIMTPTRRILSLVMPCYRNNALHRHNVQSVTYLIGQNFRHQAEISPLLSENILKSIVCKDFVRQKFCRTKFSPPSRNFATFIRKYH